MPNQKKFEPSKEGLEIKILRESLRWSQVFLAQKAGVSKGTIQNIESGRHKSLGDNFKRVREALKPNLQNSFLGEEAGKQKAEETKMRRVLKIYEMVNTVMQSSLRERFVGRLEEMFDEANKEMMGERDRRHFREA